MRSVVVVRCLIMPFAIGLFGNSGVVSMIHIPVLLSLDPVRMVALALLVMMTSCFVKVALQSWSQSWPIEMRDADLRPGKTWLIPAVGGSVGMLSCTV